MSCATCVMTTSIPVQQCWLTQARAKVSITKQWFKKYSMTVKDIADLRSLDRGKLCEVWDVTVW